MKKPKSKNSVSWSSLLSDLEKAVKEENVEGLKKLHKIIADQEAPREHYKDVSNCTNLVVLACQYNKVKSLEYLFDSDCKILNILSIGRERAGICAHDEDEMGHTSFYYAIRSGNVELLETLINKWPNSYFASHSDELDEILSAAYEELKLKNVPLTDEMEIFVEHKLIKLRFFSNTSEQDQGLRCELSNIAERIELIVQNIRLLKSEYESVKKVDMRFIFVAKFVAQNIHVLKRQLRSTYDRLPWEEMEFCLVSFISCNSKRQEINLYYQTTLSKDKMLNYLENFAKKLEAEKGTIERVHVSRLADLPKLRREKVVTGVIKSSPEFKELYNDYQQIRDIYSLEKINDYIQLALSVNPKEREGQLIITRVLQVIGEYLKNTLESPKMSNATSELFLLLLSKNTRNIIIDLRNSLSHVYALSKRTKIEEKRDVKFFSGVQNDTKKIGDVIVDILYNKKLKIMRTILQRIIDSNNIEEIGEIARVLASVKVDAMMPESFKMVEHEKLEKLVREFSDRITDKTDYEVDIFKKIDDIINSRKTQFEDIRKNYTIGFYLLREINGITEDVAGDSVVQQLKLCAEKILQYIAPKMEPSSVKDIAVYISKIWHVRSNVLDDRLQQLCCEIFLVTEYDMDNVKCIEDLGGRLGERGALLPEDNCTLTEEEWNRQLESRLHELKSILKTNELKGQATEKLPSYKNNRKLQAVVEMLMLDIMSILGGTKNYLENNLLFLDESVPLLTGKCLRNHLAHDNVLLGVLLSDPSVAVVLNAKVLTERKIMKAKKKIGKLVRDDPSRLRDKYEQGLNVVANQEKMFATLEAGDLEGVRDCLKGGADINARSLNSWNALHFAASGPSLEVVKFVLDQNPGLDVTDVYGQSPLHIAAAYGRASTVEFFLKRANFKVSLAGTGKKSPLFLAVRGGFREIVEMLLKTDPNFDIHATKDSALRVAIQRNHLDVVKLLFERETNFDLHETVAGFTLLHIAAEAGHLEIVKFLVERGAEVDAKNDNGETPMYIATRYHHSDVVTYLISKGADVNCRVLDDCTPLHMIASNGYEDLSEIFLDHGARPNVADKGLLYTPLHLAAKSGHDRIAAALLEHNANPRAAAVDGTSPLHLAAHGGHLRTVKVLLQHGADIDARQQQNATPLTLAADAGRAEVVEFLAKRGADVNARSSNDLTALHLAALHGHLDVVALLLKFRAAVAARDAKGNTPLHQAALSGSNDIIELLVEGGADVNARGKHGVTPLHVAAQRGHENSVMLLVKHSANVNSEDRLGVTALYAAALQGHGRIAEFLMRHGADVNAADAVGRTPLVAAVEAGHKHLIEVLVKGGADVNRSGRENFTPLMMAVHRNSKEMVHALIASGATIGKDDDPLSLPVCAGFRDMVEILLKFDIDVNKRDPKEGNTILHTAALKPDAEIVRALLARGAKVNALNHEKMTPLHYAVKNGNEEVAEVLIASGADVNAICQIGGLTPLHLAAFMGHSGVTKVLLDHHADVDIKDEEGKTALHRAIIGRQVGAVRVLVQSGKIDIQAKDANGFTILHYSVHENNLDIVTYLVGEGCDVHATNASKSKSIHIAAREGHREIVEFFLTKGLAVDEPGLLSQTPLHYAAINGHLNVVEFLISHGADVNAADQRGTTVLHIAATFGHQRIVEALLKSGAVYDAADRQGATTLGAAETGGLLSSTAKLFDAVKKNNPAGVERSIRSGACVDARNSDNATPLHYAAWKGFDAVVRILLRNEANPNTIGSKGCTPLHYAAKFSHMKVVMALLSSGAMYNAVSESGKTPLDFAEDNQIASVLKSVAEAFKNVATGSARVVSELNKMKHVDTVRAIMSARDRNNRSLIIAAVHSNFPKLNQLKEILQGDISSEISEAMGLASQGDYQKSLSILREALKKRTKILGPDNPATLDIQSNIALVLYKAGSFEESVNLLQQIISKQVEMFGLDDKVTLKTRGTLALVYLRQGRIEECLKMFEEVHRKQIEFLGADHSDTLETQMHMAAALQESGRFEEALTATREVFENRRRVMGEYHPTTILSESNMATFLSSLDKPQEALELHEKVFEKKKLVFGANHPDTLRTYYHIGTILTQQKRFNESIKVHTKLLDIQRNMFGEYHPDFLRTHYGLGNVYFAQGKHISALKNFREGLERRKAVFGPHHPHVLDTYQKVEEINTRFKLEGSDVSAILQLFQKDINVAAGSGDARALRRLLSEGADPNDTDGDGRAPLHYAVSEGRHEVINILIAHGADVTRATNKGNTPLHTATSKGDVGIVNSLLNCVTQKKLGDFVDAKTATGGTTALHVAAKGGHPEIVKSLLKSGATYDVKNKDGKVPADLSKDQQVTDLLKLIDDLFCQVGKGDSAVVGKLKGLESAEISVITKTRSNQGNTLLQVALVHKHKTIAGQLLQMLKMSK